MITLHIAKLLEVEGFGTLDQDIFWEEVALNAQGNAKDGIWVVSLAPQVDRFSLRQSFEIYSRYSNKVTGAQKLEKVLEFLQEAYGSVCTLPKAPPHSNAEYINVRIKPTSGVQSIGKDENNKIVRVIGGEVQYERKQ